MAGGDSPATSTANQSRITNEAERARVRRNQQNSRARKRAYVEELEQRRDECHRLGCRATEESERELRRTREENIVLRALLKERGVDDAHITNVISYALGDEATTQTMPAISGQDTSQVENNSDAMINKSATYNLQGQTPAPIISDQVLFDIIDSVDGLSHSMTPSDHEFQGDAYNLSLTSCD